jgi:transposase
VRFRRTLAETLAKERNRTLKLLETANIKLASVATDVFGVSGMAMLKALLDGTMSPDGMAELAKGRLRAKREPLTRALRGRLTEHHRFLLRLQLRRLEEIERDLSELAARIAQAMAPFRRQQDRLKQIPGVDAVAAAGIIAEIGIDMSVFGSARRLAAWAGVCPGNHESAGRRKKGTTRKGTTCISRRP